MPQVRSSGHYPFTSSPGRRAGGFFLFLLTRASRLFLAVYIASATLSYVFDDRKPDRLAIALLGEVDVPFKLFANIIQDLPISLVRGKPA
jgi:hypothetical protein